MRKLLTFALTVVIAMIGSANAAVISYRFTATQTSATIRSTLPPTTLAILAQPFPAISGVISWDAPPPSPDPHGGYYQLITTLTIDQFLAAAPFQSELWIENDVPGVDPTTGAPILFDSILSVGFYLSQGPFSPFHDVLVFLLQDLDGGGLSSAAVPATLDLNELDFVILSLRTYDNITGTFSSVGFQVTSLTPIREIPAPGALLLFASGLGAAGMLRRKRCARGASRRRVNNER